MDLESLSREDLLRALRQLLQTRDVGSPAGGQPERGLRELEVHNLEQELQNRQLREAQLAVEESRNRFANLYDFAPVAYFTLDVHGVVQELNLTGAALIGRERDAAIGLPLLRFVVPEDHRTFMRHLTNCIGSLTPVVGEFRLQVHDRYVDVQASSVPAFALGGAARTVRTALVDITLRKHAETEREAALESEQRLRTQLEALDRAHIEAAGALTMDGGALEQVMRVIVRHARMLAGARWAGLELSPDHLQLEPPAMEPAEDGGLRASDRDGPRIELRMAYGERQLARLSVARAALDPPFTAEERRALKLLAERLSSSLEIARLHAIDARDRLRLSLLERVTNRLRNVHEMASARSALADIAGALVPDFADVCLVHLVQDGGLSLLCVRHVELAQQHRLAAQLRSPDTDRGLARSLSELATSHEPHLMRRPLEGRETTRAPFADLTRTLQTKALIVAPLWARDRSLGVMCFGRLASSDAYDLAMLTWAQEISDRCAAAMDASMLVHELRDALQWRENLMAMISHDLKSPLSAISLSAMSMVPESPQIERRSSRKQVHLIKRSADHMHKLVNDLLSASLLEAGSFRVELRRESAYELVEEACQLVEPLLHARAIELERAFTKELPSVFADREPLQRVFSNLLGNAAKFTPPGGRIRVSASFSDNTVLFSVSDSGPGIPEAQQGHMFERYWKGSKASTGLGLGLYISKAIVQAHAGRIWLQGDSSEGATFCFELRRCDPAH
jgi:PAS domain S-box-containing protein